MMYALSCRLFVVFTFICVTLTAQTTYFNVSVSTTPYSCSPGAAKITVSGGQSPYFFNWSNGLQGDHETNLVPAIYTISIVDGAGRDTVITLEIGEQKCKVTGNTTFSPNGDDINDYWTLNHIQNYPNFTLEVYNRWGQIVHQQKSTFEPWNGKHLGVDVPVGTYYYIFFYDGKDGESEQGSITLMR